MASVFKRDGRWYLRFKDSAGRWTQQPSAARTKTQARRLADELERKAERERLRLEPIPTDSDLSLAELCEWWLEPSVSAGESLSRAQAARGPREEHLVGATAP